MRSVDDWKAIDAAARWEREQRRLQEPPRPPRLGVLDYLMGGYCIILALIGVILNFAFLLSPVLLLVWLFKG